MNADDARRTARSRIAMAGNRASADFFVADARFHPVGVLHDATGIRGARLTCRGRARECWLSPITRSPSPARNYTRAG
jgi:hypothetical protein